MDQGSVHSSLDQFLERMFGGSGRGEEGQDDERRAKGNKAVKECRQRKKAKKEQEDRMREELRRDNDDIERRNRARQQVGVRGSAINCLVPCNLLVVHALQCVAHDPVCVQHRK